MDHKSMAESLESMRIAKGRAALYRLIENAYTRPLESDVGRISCLYDRFHAVCAPGNKDNSKIFVLLAFYLYQPASLVGDKTKKDGVRRELARVIGVSPPAVSRIFNEGKSLFWHHKGFRKEAERVFAAMRPCREYFF